MRKLVFALSLCAFIGAYGQQDSLKFRILLTDKAATTYSTERPEEFLSEKAINRRVRQNLPVDSTDLPVCERYVNAIRDKGVRIVATGKWENFVTVSCNDSSLISEIAELPFVRCADRVWKAPRGGNTDKAAKRRPLVDTIPAKNGNYYGRAYGQISYNNGDKLHEAGFRGKGMTIAVIDAGYHNVDKMPALNNARILGARDFVNPGSDVYAGGSHGLKVLSCMAANKPHILVGTAPEASYWLLCSEDEASEFPVEEDYAAAAIEYADSLGVDLINMSLGYYAFDDKTKNYRYRDLDGARSLLSRQASRIANKGMVLVCSAGNAGIGSWKKITPPGDARHVLTVGAITKDSLLAPFSSIGNTADGRIKPDAVAIGLQASVLGTSGQPDFANGTSFASPILCGMVACLWQACPELNATEIIEAVKQAGDRVDFPDNIYGYGIPDMWKAYQSVSNNP